MIDLRVATEQPGWHRWPLAPDHRAYLRERHLHNFLFEILIPVNDPDREIEFHDARQELERAVHDIAPTCEFGDKSCEMLAQEVLRRISHAKEARVSEDELHGAIVTREDVMTREPKPIRIITVCGSTRFRKETEKALLELEKRGIAALSVGSFTHAEGLVWTPGQKDAFDALHKDKIRMSHGIYVVNPNGYVGGSTASEIMLAWSLGKSVEWMYPQYGVPYGPLSAFYRRMERKLLLNAFKGGWQDMSVEALIEGLEDEVAELKEAYAAMRESGLKTHDDVADEAADVANRAMMVADILFRPRQI